MSKPDKKHHQQHQKHQQPTATPAPKPVTELTDTVLSQVIGGLNPQPLPPNGLDDPCLTPPSPI